MQSHLKLKRMHDKMNKRGILMEINLDVNKIVQRLSAQIADLVTRNTILQLENDELKEKLTDKKREVKTQ